MPFHTKEEIPCYRGPSPMLTLVNSSTTPEGSSLSAAVPESGYALQTGAGYCWTVDAFQIQISWVEQSGQANVFVGFRAHHSNAAKFSGALRVTFSFFDGVKNELLTLPINFTMDCVSGYDFDHWREDKISKSIAETLHFVMVRDDATKAMVCG